MNQSEGWDVASAPRDKNKDKILLFFLYKTESELSIKNRRNVRNLCKLCKAGRGCPLIWFIWRSLPVWGAGGGCVLAVRCCSSFSGQDTVLF